MGRKVRKIKLKIKTILDKIDLNPNNSIVIGSGILSVLNLRESKDIDVIVTEEKYKDLADNNHFKKGQNHGREILVNDLLEIGIDWTVLDRTWKFDDLLNYSTIIGGVRYITIEFLLNAKRGWVADGEGRQKDIEDIELIEQYLRQRSLGC